MNNTFSDNNQIGVVSTFSELVNTDFQGAMNAICWRRNLSGDFKNYERDEELDFISTDVYSYHVDRSPIGTDTFLCTYHGAASDILPNNQVEQKILIPEIREKLKKLHNGPETEFEAFLKEYFFDLHYQPKPNAEPVNLQSGHLWRLAVDHPAQQVLPCVHRAPVENDGEYRLLLIC